jgi:hypothetical protein
MNTKKKWFFDSEFFRDLRVLRGHILLFAFLRVLAVEDAFV